jgi:uncharacterized protein (TIGR02118 family)
MVVRLGLLTRREDIGVSEFRSHWRNVHGAIAARLPHLRRYHQNQVVDRRQRAIDYPRGGWDFDGVSELWFDDLPSMHAAFASPVVEALAADEKAFIGDIKLVTAIQHEVIPVSRDEPLIKRMSTLRRKKGISAETFMREWFDVHSLLVRRLPQVRGYRQNLVFDRSLGRGKPASYEDLPIDGVVELWFRDAESLDEAFNSPAGQTLMTHAQEFIGEISTFLVDCQEVL